MLFSNNRLIQLSGIRPCDYDATSGLLGQGKCLGAPGGSFMAPFRYQFEPAISDSPWPRPRKAAMLSVSLTAS
jgi:hypothetical protein